MKRVVKFIPNTAGIAVISVIVIIIFIVVMKNRNKTTSSENAESKIQKVINSITGKSYTGKSSWDSVTDKRISTLHPKVRAKAKEFIIRADKELGIKLRITSGFRTYAKQSELYAQGRTTAGKIVTNAKAGQSFHNFGLAFDVVEIKNRAALWNNPNWGKIAKLGKSMGFEWGGDWKSIKDKPHFQLSFSRSLSQLRALYSSGKRTGEYVNLVT